MTKKGEYAILHERETWTIVRAASCYWDGRVKEYLEAPGRCALRAGTSPEQIFFDIPGCAQPAAKRIFEAQQRFETADDLKAALNPKEE